MSTFEDEMRRQINEEVYPALTEILQTLDSLPEDTPNRPAFEAAIQETLAKARIAEAMLAHYELDEDDDKLVTELKREERDEGDDAR